MSTYRNRLTVIGKALKVRAFQNSNWLKGINGRYADPLELSPRRFACQFETTASPLEALRRLSRKHPGLVFLLDYEVGRTKGLAKLKSGELELYTLRY